MKDKKTEPLISLFLSSDMNSHYQGIKQLQKIKRLTITMYLPSSFLTANPAIVTAWSVLVEGELRLVRMLGECRGNTEARSLT